MKQIVITKYGDTDVLKIQTKQDPKPSAGEVLIKVKAIGVNFADILARKGLYPDAPKPPPSSGQKSWPYCFPENTQNSF